MPSLIGHSLMGYIIYQAAVRPVGVPMWQQVAVCLFAANAPDLDFVPGLFGGDFASFHHGPSHSISFAILFGCLVAIFSSARKIYAFTVSSLLYLSHVVLDYLVQDPSFPHGVPLVWPFSHEYYMAPFAFFPRFDYPITLTHSVRVFFTFHNLLTIGTEILFLLPLLILVSVWANRRGLDSKASR
jgi:inner membrane protein